MRRAAVDIGTNSTRLLLADIDEDSYRPFIRQTVITRLGEDVNRTHRLKPEAIDRTLRTLREYNEVILDSKAQSVSIAATSAVRDADNSMDLTGGVFKLFNQAPKILSGADEGRLTFIGAAWGPGSVVDPSERALIVDVGGGSAEFIWGQAGRIEGVESLDFGAVRLTELLIANDPPLRQELDRVRDYARSHGATLWSRLTSVPVQEIVGVAGTATTLVAVRDRLEPYDSERVHGAIIGLQEIDELLTLFTSVDLEARKKLPGLQPERADVIVAGTLILMEILKALRAKRLLLSEHDILDGLVKSACF